MPRNRLCACVAAILCLSALLVSCVPSVAGDSEGSAALEVKDVSYVWQFSCEEDMQLPELPTGCEATAAATLLRMNGIQATKTAVADAMPKSSTDFVNSFLGDPYSDTGWACCAPCVAETISGFLGTGLKAIELTGTPLAELPTPCCVWVSINLADVAAAVREQDGYGLFANSHCVVITEIGETEVSCIDPLRGDVEYERTKFEEVFDAMGSQSVYIADTVSAEKLLNERGVG